VGEQGVIGSTYRKAWRAAWLLPVNHNQSAAF
jgi:hypothetical protein